VPRFLLTIISWVKIFKCLAFYFRAVVLHPQPTYINTGEEQFEQVNSFKYFEKMVNTDNSMEEEIKERIAAGNRAYQVHKNYFHQN